MTAAQANGGNTEAGDRSFVVDASRTVLESNAPELVVGTQVTASSWLGAEALGAIAAAAGADCSPRRVGRDYARGTHWLVYASIVGHDPWRARVVAIDATAAVIVDRHAVLATLVHAMQNISFALLSVLEAIELDRPTGALLGEYLGHLHEPAGRLSSTMTLLTACIVPRRPSLERVSVEAVVARALSRVARDRRPVPAAILPVAMSVSADVELLSEAIAAMIESGEESACPVLEIHRVDVDGRPHACVVVERGASLQEQRAPAALWDLAGGHRLDVPLRLSRGRDVILAHGGNVLGESVARGRVRLVVRLPLLTEC